MNTADVLRAAKELIQQEGWVQRSYHLEGGYCAVGATIAAMGFDPAQDDSMSRLANALLVGALPDGLSIVWMFNDEPGRTVEEIYELFDRAIARTLT